MAYLGIAVEEARELMHELARNATEIDAVLHHILEAETLADLPADATGELSEVQRSWYHSAAEIRTALSVVEHFQLRLPRILGSARAPSPPEPERTPEPVVLAPADPLAMQMPLPVALPPVWDATSSAAWNDVHQAASHNSYAVSGGVQLLFDLGVRSFELDIHRTGSIDFGVGLVPWSSKPPASMNAPDWRVYHLSGHEDAEYDYFTDGLLAVASLDTTDPITVFVDNKDGFGGAHSVERFDELVVAALGDRLYRPSDFARRAPEAPTLQQVVAAVGWPTVDELEGRVMVVLTDRVERYLDEGSAAFVAQVPALVEVDGVVEHRPADDVVFYNVSARGLRDETRAAVAASGSVLRTYFGPHCPSAPIDEPAALPNYWAIDADIEAPPCAPRSYPPPVDTPVPEPDVGSD